MTASRHPGRVWVPPTLAEVVLRQDVVGRNASRALSGLLQLGDARDESLSEH